MSDLSPYFSGPGSTSAALQQLTCIDFACHVQGCLPTKFLPPAAWKLASILDDHAPPSISLGLELNFDAPCGFMCAGVWLRFPAVHVRLAPRVACYAARPCCRTSGWSDSSGLSWMQLHVLQLRCHSRLPQGVLSVGLMPQGCLACSCMSWGDVALLTASGRLTCGLQQMHARGPSEHCSMLKYILASVALGSGLDPD